ncbi:MAG: NAD(P)H-hydrate dehydratase [Elusimicrobia bacterium]|nr:NAD(P)H-hydrate dehydratase [Elusimicrobiota bacterium]
MTRPQILSARTIRPWIPQRKADSHKGDYGHTLIVAGSKGMSGAAMLSSLGALRGGSGLVTVALPESLQPIAAKFLRPEAMSLPLPETRQGTIHQKAAAFLTEWIRKRKVTSLAVGPGLSRDPRTIQFVRALYPLLNQTEVSGIVLDADGFLALKAMRGSPSPIIIGKGLPTIVTPHAGEMTQFCDGTSLRNVRDRMELAEKFAKLYRVVCVLKGHRTVISDGERTYVNPTGNPGMATGGSGDVLTGLIAALVSQKSKTTMSPNARLLQSACVGVYVHGLAGDIGRNEKTEISLIAGDIAESIPKAFKELI